MLKTQNVVCSPSRTYVAVCNRTNFDGNYFRRFQLPRNGQTEGYQENGVWVEGSYTPFYPNDASTASWYFLNVLNFQACIDGCIPVEQYLDMKDQDDLNQAHREEMDRLFPRFKGYSCTHCGAGHRGTDCPDRLDGLASRVATTID